MSRRTEDQLRANLPIAEVVINIPRCLRDVLKRKDESPIGAVRCFALIDSGASNSSVSFDILSNLGIRPAETGTMMTPSSLKGRQLIQAISRYRISFSIMMTPSPLTFDPLLVTGMNLRNLPFHAIIGMDILKLGVFTLDGKNDKYTLELP